MKKPRRRSPEEIARILAKFRESGKSQSAFTKKQGLALSTLQYWLRKERESRRPAKRPAKPKRTPRRIVPVRVVDPPAPRADSLVEIELSSGEKLRFPADLPSEALSRLIEVLRRRC